MLFSQTKKEDQTSFINLLIFWLKGYILPQWGPISDFTFGTNFLTSMGWSFLTL